MRTSISKLVFPVVTFMVSMFMLGHLFTGTAKIQVVTIKEISKQSSYKIKSDNPDGSVDVIFNLPNSSQLARKLKEHSPEQGKIMTMKSKIIDSSSADVISNKSRKNNSKALPEKKTLYPLTLTSPYLINNASVCSNAKKLDFIVVVHTSTDHFSRRRIIRETWANKNIFKTNGSRIVFLCGRPYKQKLQTMIENESSVYGDIVQGDFRDSYHNLTHKGVMAYRWVSEHCLNVDMVLKVDDDMFVNIFHLLEYHLPVYRNSSRLISCHVRPKGTSPIARKGSKWTVQPDQFKNMTHYPVTYCNGYFVLMTPDIIKEMYLAAFWTPFFWVDDVYLYGMLPFKAGKIRHKSIASILTLNQNTGMKCYNKNSSCSFLASHAVKEGYMEQMWYAAINMYRSLAKKFLVNDILS